MLVDVEASRLLVAAPTMSTSSHTLTVADLRVGDEIDWLTWCGRSDVYVVQYADAFHVTAYRVGARWTEPPMYWDATCYRSLAEQAPRGLRVVSPLNLP